MSPIRIVTRWSQYLPRGYVRTVLLLVPAPQCEQWLERASTKGNQDRPHGVPLIGRRDPYDPARHVSGSGAGRHHRGRGFLCRDQDLDRLLHHGVEYRGQLERRITHFG